MTTDTLTTNAVELLRQLIAIPSVSREEQAAADAMERHMDSLGLHPQRVANNVWAVAPKYDDAKPTLLLNAHLDTVKPTAAWTRQPHSPDIEDDRLYGLGSNDCGGGLVALLQAFRAMAHSPRSYNLVYLASAEEEVSGAYGVELALPQLPPIHAAIVGEPTAMQPATAEKGLMVIDATAYGQPGHAARNEGINAIYLAIDDIEWLRQYHFDRVSTLLGHTKATTTIIQAGTQHNVVPAECHFTIDVRTNELYTNQEVFEILVAHMHSTLKARSFRLNSSCISAEHPLVRRCAELSLTPFGSPTLSDQALMPFPSLKLGPGQSARSHSADEYICISEIHRAIELYIELLSNLRL